VRSEERKRTTTVAAATVRGEHKNRERQLAISTTTNLSIAIMKSPKGILSESIAEALADYFVVDPKHISTNLVSDAGVTLRNVALKPLDAVRINAQAVVSVTGSVRSVAFHWKWGGDSEMEGGSSFVKDAKLSIDGLDFTACLSNNNNSNPTSQPETNSDNNSNQAAPSAEQEQVAVPENQKGKIKAYIDDQVNRIIDTLTLVVTDFQFKIQIDGSKKSLVFGGSGLKLESFGRKSVIDVLEQQLTIESIFSNILVGGGTTGSEEPLSKPLLDAVSYKASCTRFSGKRFSGGIATGLQVIGESIDAGVAVHAGTDQIRFLNELAGYLLEKQKTTATNNKSKENDPERPDSDDKDDKPVSLFQFPLSAVSLFFPNETKISMAGLVLNYMLDGSSMIVEGRDGFLVNGYPFLSFPATCQWQADLVEKRFRVHSTDNRESSNTVASIHARSADVDSVKDGAQELLSIFHEISSEKAGALGKITDIAAQTVGDDKILPSNEQAQAQTAWRVGIEGGLSVVLEDSDEEGVTVDCLVRNIDASLRDMTLSVGTVEKLRFPGSIRLSEPLKNTTLTFDGTLLDMSIGDIVATLEEPPPSQMPTNGRKNITLPSSSIRNGTAGDQINDEQDDSATVPFVLPFGGKLSVSNVTVYETDGQSTHTTIKALQAFVGPDASPSHSEGTILTGAVRVLLLVEELSHEMIRFTEKKVSGIVHPENLNVIQSFEFGARSIAIATGYSVFDWKRLLETGDQKRERKDQKLHQNESGEEARMPLKLPFAHIQPLKCKIAVKGDLVGTKGSTLHLKEFKGTATTTVDDLVLWYNAHLISNVPGFVSNADVLGFNVADTAVSLGAGASPGAGVLGMVGFDTLKNTVKAGKKSRGAEEDDKFQFVDLFRGIGQAAKDAASGGAAMRGKNVDEKANAIDWALGATSDVASYTNKNKSRLGGAGAGGVGFAVGMMLGGPAGAIAGALVASKATSATIDIVDHRFLHKSQAWRK